MKKQIYITGFCVLLALSKTVSAETQDQLKALKNPDVFKRASALAAIEKESEPSPEYIPALIEILTSKDIKPEFIAIGMRHKATLILGKIGAPAVPEVRRLMHGEDTRWMAVGILQ